MDRQKDCSVTKEEAIALLPDGEDIHTILNPPGGMLLGADWSRAEALKELEAATVIKLSGEMARDMGQGLAFLRDLGKGKEWIFVATDKAKLEAFDPPKLLAGKPVG